MLEHLNSSARTPRRVVILGAQGFVGAASARLLAANGVPVLPLGRAEADLLAAGTASRLSRELRPDDAVVVISARAPCKDAAMLVDNVRMMECVCQALAPASVSHVIYISSDAVYRELAHAPDRGIVRRAELAAWRDASGARGDAEVGAHGALGDPASDAPVRRCRPAQRLRAQSFRRLAAAGQEIVLFGEGEEQRDHVLIDDVAEIIRRVLMHRSRGVLNVATGSVHSFRDIAERIAAMYDPPVPVRGTPRQGPMPHGGYRPFDSAASQQAFPDFRYTDLATGLAKAKAEHSQQM